MGKEFKATLTFPARDPFGSNPESELLANATSEHRGTFASGHESPLLEAARWDAGWDDTPGPPPAERSTLPAPPDESTGVIELSGSMLESDRDTALAYASLRGNLAPAALPADLLDDPGWEKRDTVRPPAAPEPLRAELLAAEERARKAEEALGEARQASERRAQTRKQLVAALHPRRTLLRRILVPVIVSNVAVALAVGVLARVTVKHPLAEPTARVAVVGRSPLGTAPAPLDVAPAQSCAASGASRVLASRAQLGPGLDVSPLDSGFAVGLAAGATETVALRVEGRGLRIAERVKNRASQVVRRLAVDPGDDDGLDVRVDSEEARTIVGALPFRVVARGGVVTAQQDSGPAKVLWSLPARTDLPKVAPASAPKMPAFLARLGSERTSFDRKARVGKDAKPSTPVALPPPPETVRAAALREGGAVIVVRRTSQLLVGLVDPALRADGGLVTIARKTPVLTPAVASAGTGGIVVWSEKSGADSLIMAALVTPDGEGSRIAALEVLGKGATPSITELPDGDLLLAFTETVGSAHRVVARRLAHDLSVRGEPLVVSPQTADALQPVTAVRPDGSAIVAFFTADRRGAAVVATPLACD